MCGCASIGFAAPASAQSAVAPAVDGATASRLIWSTIVALDQANVTGNYSVLRDLGAPAFQAGNSAATLAGAFQALRAQQVDLGLCVSVVPNLEFPPTIVQGGLLRLRGGFPLRPVGVAFDMLFANVGGQWRLFGLAVVPAIPQTPAAPARPAQNGSTRR